jgi:homoserine kinase
MQSMFGAQPVRVAVPATSANLGPGYDALGLALSLEDEVTAQVTAGGIRVDVVGEGAGEVPRGPEHLIVRTMWRTFELLGVARPDGLALTCHNRIPHARGLGSSSAAIVAGIVLARALVIRGAGGLDDAAALGLAAEIEGHPDNVAPCLLGGFTIAWTPQDGGARAVRLDPEPTLRPTVFVPTTRGLTAHARAALPAMVPHADAAFNAARAALMVHALTAAPSLLLEATQDRLHQDYRAFGMPETAALVRSLRQSGVPAFVSGAGPSVLALPSGPLPPVPEGWCARSLSVSSTGARILIGRHAEGDHVAAGPPS